VAIGRLSDTLALGLCVLAVLFLRSDQTLAEPRWRAVFLGRVSAAADTSFGRLTSAMKRLELAAGSRIDIDFMSVGGPDGLINDQLVRNAIATKPNLLIAPNGSAAVAARRLGAPIPLVFASYLDPVREGIVSSLLPRPEAATGVWVVDELDPKRIEILSDAYPSLRNIAVMGDRSWSKNVDAPRTLATGRPIAGLKVTVLLADTLEEAQSILSQPQSRNFDAWCIPRSYMALLSSQEIIATLREWGKPAIFGSHDIVLAGAPMAYGPDTSQVWVAMASLVWRVRHGESAGSLPVERPQRFVLSVRATRDTGLPPPDISVVRKADIVIR
jgi:putative tryptophan/tyrosine transport system substrate-binding protein